MTDKRIKFKRKPSGYLGTVLIGMGFAAGWTPCTGPILAAVIALGMTNPSAALFYMMWYVIGFSIPFLLLTFFIGKVKWINKYSNRIMKIGGYIMVVMGIVLYFDWMTRIISFLTNHLLVDGLVFNMDLTIMMFNMLCNVYLVIIMFHTIVIGAGQAGLIMGYCLKQSNRSFLILDKNQEAGEVWYRRYDSLVLFTARM